MHKPQETEIPESLDAQAYGHAPALSEIGDNPMVDQEDLLFLVFSMDLSGNGGFWCIPTLRFCVVQPCLFFFSAIESNFLGRHDLSICSVMFCQN